MEVHHMQLLELKYYNKWIKQVNTWSGVERNFASIALRVWMADPKSYDAIVMLNVKQEIHGILVYTKRTQYDPECEWHVSLLAVKTKNKGFGTVLMQAMFEFARIAGGVVTVTSTKRANGFYEKLGMKAVNLYDAKNVYMMNREEISNYFLTKRAQRAERKLNYARA